MGSERSKPEVVLAEGTCRPWPGGADTPAGGRLPASPPSITPPSRNSIPKKSDLSFYFILREGTGSPGGDGRSLTLHSAPKNARVVISVLPEDGVAGRKRAASLGVRVLTAHGGGGLGEGGKKKTPNEKKPPQLLIFFSQTHKLKSSEHLASKTCLLRST